MFIPSIQRATDSSFPTITFIHNLSVSVGEQDLNKSLDKTPSRKCVKVCCKKDSNINTRFILFTTASNIKLNNVLFHKMPVIFLQIIHFGYTDEQ